MTELKETTTILYKKLGIANGKYVISDNMDECNGEKAEMFGVDVFDYLEKK